MSTELAQQIAKLKTDRGAVILAHNYQLSEVQDIADFTGDSLELSRKAAATDAKVIVFCGVHFMAETAKILSPDKIVLIPDPNAGCPMADMITADELREFKAMHPGVPVVAYVNTSAEVKAESTICCTSANAVRVVESLDSDTVLFVPDKSLGAYVASKTSKKVIPYSGFCPTHHRILARDVISAKREHPYAVVVAHPECTPDVLALADGIESTSGMLQMGKGERREGVHSLHRARPPSPSQNGQPGQDVLQPQRAQHLSEHEEDHARKGTLESRGHEIRDRDRPGHHRQGSVCHRRDDCDMISLSRSYVERVVRAALDEDIGSGDITTLLTVPVDTTASANIVAKSSGIIAGIGVARTAFAMLDPKIAFQVDMTDGSVVEHGDHIAGVSGDAHPILSAERVALNFLQRMSGIATLTATYVSLVAHTHAKIIDTRKTTPGLRLLEKYAVTVGGGANHRFNLSDGILIKDNHIAAAGGIKNAVTAAKANAPHTLKIEVEVDDSEPARTGHIRRRRRRAARQHDP